MIKKISDIFKKHSELILYIIFGVLTTLVNLVSFSIFTLIIGDKLYLLNNAIAWIISVIFAYFTNKLFVFNSKSFAAKVLFKEFTEFLIARIFSFLVEEFGMWFFIDILGFNNFSINIIGFNINGQLITKILLSVIVVIMNYFFSKFFIFAKKQNNDKIS